jgi:hypothetical protein
MTPATTRLELARERVLQACRLAFEPGPMAGRLRAILNASHELLEAEREADDEPTLPDLRAAR